MGLSNDEAARLEELLASLHEVRGRIYPNGQRFIDDLSSRLEDEGADMYMSGPQWRWLLDLHEQYC